MMNKSKNKKLKFDKLDNTANLFPVIANKNTSNVYRISVYLDEPVDSEILQEALEIVLPKVYGFNVRLREGFFWTYFEENVKKAPKVQEERTSPCHFIVQNQNNSYLFRVTYFNKRINFEVFHALADGMGGFNFLRELTYQYLRLKYEDLRDNNGDYLTEGTTLNCEDSYVENYKAKTKNKYYCKNTYQIRGEKLPAGEFGVMHGKMDIAEIKAVCKKYNVSINEFVVAVYIWSVYKECLKGKMTDKIIRIAVPVNLRPFFESITMRNFFTMVPAEFQPKKEAYELGEVIDIVVTELRKHITKENLEDIFSYNVSNQKNPVLKYVPFAIKSMAMKYIYHKSASAYTSTVTNVGNIVVDDKYKKHITDFYALIPVSKGQFNKATICSYDGRISISFTAALKSNAIQKRFFRTLANEGINISIETNGVYYG